MMTKRQIYKNSIGSITLVTNDTLNHDSVVVEITNKEFCSKYADEDTFVFNNYNNYNLSVGRVLNNLQVLILRGHTKEDLPKVLISKSLIKMFLDFKSSTNKNSHSDKVVNDSDFYERMTQEAEVLLGNLKMWVDSVNAGKFGDDVKLNESVVSISPLMEASMHFLGESTSSINESTKTLVSIDEFTELVYRAGFDDAVYSAEWKEAGDTKIKLNVKNEVRDLLNKYTLKIN